MFVRMRGILGKFFAVLIAATIVGTAVASSANPSVFGQSITDACINWDATKDVLENLADAVRGRRGE